MNTPDYVQINYDRVLSDGLPGSNAGANPTFDFCFVAGAENIPYGIVISNQSVGVFPVVAIPGIANVTATAGYIYGTGSVDATASNWKAITDGAFNLFVDGADYSVTGIDLSTATDMASIATLIQTKLRTATGGTPTVTFANGVFKIASATTGSGSSVGPMLAPTSGTSLIDKMGFETFVSVAGVSAVTAAALGVVIRSVVNEARPAPNSNITAIKEGDVGAYRQDGAIKVMAEEAVTAGSSVYFDSATGKVYGSSSGTHTNALGTSKWLTNTASGAVGIIDIRGLR